MSIEQLNVRIDGQINKEKWQDLISKSSSASAFQAIEWVSFIKNLGDHGQTPFSIAIVNEQETPLALVSGVIHQEMGWKTVLTRRAVMMGGVVLNDSEFEGEKSRDKILDLLLKNLKVFLKQQKVIFTEIRNFHDYSALKDIFLKNGWKYEPHLNFHVDCTNLEEMTKRVSSSKLRQIKKSAKNGASYRWARDANEVRALYGILKSMYMNKIGTPLPNESFFLSFYKQGGRVLVVEHMNRIIGGMFCPVLPGRKLYEYYICGKDPEFKDQGIYPSVLATWGAMELANQEGIPLFDFMGAGKPDIPYGVRDFKAKFGGELVEHGRFLKVFSLLRYDFGKLAVSVLKRIKK